MKAFYEKNEIVIRVDPNIEQLFANTVGYQYLPCGNNCGELLQAPSAAVSMMCDRCFEKQPREEGCVVNE